MTIQRPTSPFPAFVALLVLGLSAQCQLASAQTAVVNPTEVAAKDFRTHLNYHMSRVDARSHPMPDSRAAYQKNATELRPELDKFDIDQVRLTLTPPSRDRSNILRLLKDNLAPIPQQILQLETRRVGLETLRNDETVEDDKKPPQEVLDRLDAKVSWLRQRQTLFQKELTALTGKRTAADDALETYTSLVTLEDAKLGEANWTNAKKRSHAESTIKLLSARLSGKNIAEVRQQLPLKQLDLALEEVGKKAREMPDRLRSPANSAPEQKQYLNELKQFYDTEVEALRKLFEERRNGGRRKAE